MLDRVAGASTAFHRRWLELLRDQPGNPCGVDLCVLAEGRIVGTVATEEPEVEWLQHVSGLESGDDEAIFELATWYAELEAWPRYEIPVHAEDDLLHTLLAVEAKPTGALAVVGAPVGDLVRLDTNPAVTVRPVEPGSPDAATFAATMLAGHEVEGATSAHAAATSAWAEQPGWRCFLADVDGEVAGGAVLMERDGVGYLANAATVPAARDQGVQTALIAARLDALAAECDIACGLAEPDGSSARNLVRAGLAVLGARTYWTSTA